MVTTQFITKKGIVSIDASVSLGDVVKISDPGCVYSHYDDAYQLLAEGVLDFEPSNLRHGSFVINLYYDKAMKPLYWVVVNKCLHRAYDCVICLVVNPLKNYALLIGEEGLSATQKKLNVCVNEKKFNFYQV